MKRSLFSQRGLFGITSVGFLVAAILLTGPSTACGGVLLSGGGTGGLVAFTGDNATAGFSFSTSVELRVSALGILDLRVSSAGTGLFEAHRVGLWNGSGTLLGQVTVSAGTVDPLINGFRFANLGTAINIGPGTYVLGAHYQTSFFNNNQAEVFRSNNATQMNAILPSWATSGSLRTAGGFNFPTGSSPGGYVGPNMLAEVVPEPASFAIFGMIGLVACGRRRKS